MKKCILFLIGFIFISVASEAQILDKIKKVKNTIAGITVEKLSADPVSTSFKDVDKKRYFDDDFGNDAAFLDLHNQPYVEGEGFLLQPGFYEGRFQSFCIKAGTYMPTTGRGRFYAPLKGPKADIIATIIEAYEQDSGLTQKEVQLLLWAIIAKTDFNKMNGPVKLTAIRLLSAEQIARLSKGSFDNLARKEMKKLAYSSNAVRAIVEAENNLRASYYRGVSTYEDYENIAMLPGEEPLVPEFGPGRWTKHPDGFFIRYYPSGYSTTKTQIYVPTSVGNPSFNPTNAIAVPADRGQRLIQTGLPSIGGQPNMGGGGPMSGSGSSGGTAGGGGNSGGGTVGGGANSSGTVPQSFCNPAFDAGVDKVIKEQMILQDLPGLAVAVYKNGKMVHLKAYGYRDLYEEIPINLNTTMEWASISKSITGVAAAQLEEKGISGYKVSHYANRYVDNWKNVTYTDTSGNVEGVDARLTSITIDQLLNNTSGIQHYGKGTRAGANNKYAKLGRDTYVQFIEEKEYSSPPGVFDAKKAVSVFNKSVIDFNPGSKWHYSSYGFVLAGATIDKAAPNGYVDWVQKNIADKIGMQSFSIAEPPGWGHKKTYDGMLTSHQSNRAEWTLPGGGYQSNICDLAKYTYALSTGVFFDGQKDQLWNNSVTASVGGSLSYSYGLYFRGTGNNFRVYHGGHGGNSRSYMQFFPTDSTGIALMAPAEYANLPELTKYIFQELNVRPTLYSGLTPSPYDKCERGMTNGSDLFYGVWRRRDGDVLIRTGYETAAFFKEIERLQDSGYNCVDVETYMNEGKRYWDAVLKKGVPKTKLVYNLSRGLLETTTNGLKQEGFILRDVESYLDNGSRKWAGVYSKENKKSQLMNAMQTQELRNEHDRALSNGLQIVDIECYPNGNLLDWSGVWVKGPPSKMELNIDPTTFYDKVRSMRGQGYRLVDVEYYMLNNQDWRVGAVWEQGAYKEFITGETGDSASMQKFCDHMETHYDQSRAGLELVDWERIDVEWFD